MRKPLSIHARLLIAALATTLAALIVTGWTLRGEIVHVIAENLSAKIDTQVFMIERGIASDGKLDPRKTQFLADFTTPEVEWGWRIKTRAGQSRGGIRFGDVRLWSGFLEPRDSVVNGRAQAMDGTPLYVRVLSNPKGTIEVAVPMERLNETLRPAMRKMLVALAILAAVLVGATLLQLRFGLKPLHALEDDLARVRNGEAQMVSAVQPRELMPLAQQVNALVEENAAGLAHARAHVANLAHGLKTPLATLTLALRRQDEESRAKAQALVADLDQRIDHHLGRARAAAAGSGERARADACEVAHILLPAMQHLHVEKHLELSSLLPSPTLVGVDRRDLDEMLGNLLDNACRHARSRVQLSASRAQAYVHLTVEDDGPGIPEAALHSAMQAGIRLDESGRGYGFGLGIVHELCELYGGSLDLGRSPELGGLIATLILPSR